MEYLEEFYNDKIKVKGMPEFKGLTDRNKTKLAGTLGFAGYKMNKVASACGRSMKELAESLMNFKQGVKHIHKSKYHK